LHRQAVVRFGKVIFQRRVLDHLWGLIGHRLSHALWLYYVILLTNATAEGNRGNGKRGNMCFHNGCSRQITLTNIFFNGAVLVTALPIDS
jgi:hypothetical protein